MSSFVLNVVILAFGTLFGASLDRTYLAIRGKSKPSFSYDSARSLRKAIGTARGVFEEVVKQNGLLGHPWQVRGQVIDFEDLTSELLAGSAAIGNRDLSASIEKIVKHLKGVEDNPYVSFPRVIILGNFEEPESALEKQDRELRTTIAGLQNSLSTGGTHQCNVASKKLNSLSRNL